MGNGQDAGQVGPQAVEGGLAQGNLSGETEQQVQGDRQHGIDPHEYQDIEQVAALEQHRHGQDNHGEQSEFE